MKKKEFCILTISFTFLISCKKTELPNYPVIPSIQIDSLNIVKGFDMLGNEAYFLHINSKYTDGDSNFGGNSEQNGEYKFDCIYTIYEKTNGAFRLMDFPLNPEFLDIPRMETKKIICKPITVCQKNIYEGTLEIEWIYFVNYFGQNDTIKCTVQILDRDFNFSNISEIEKVIENK